MLIWLLHTSSWKQSMQVSCGEALSRRRAENTCGPPIWGVRAKHQRLKVMSYAQ